MRVHAFVRVEERMCMHVNAYVFVCACAHMHAYEYMCVCMYVCVKIKITKCHQAHLIKTITNMSVHTSVKRSRLILQRRQ